MDDKSVGYTNIPVSQQKEVVGRQVFRVKMMQVDEEVKIFPPAIYGGTHLKDDKGTFVWSETPQ